MRNPRMFFTIIIILILGNLIVLNIISDREKNRLLKEQIDISSGIQFYKESEFEKSYNILKNYSEREYGNSYILNIYLARCSDKLGEYDDAKKYYKYAYNIYPQSLKDKDFIKELFVLEGKINAK